jgi:hypothetical protein
MLENRVHFLAQVVLGGGTASFLQVGQVERVSLKNTGFELDGDTYLIESCFFSVEIADECG